MTLLTWHDSLYGIGVKTVDDQHKRILVMINNLRDSLQRGGGNSEVGVILKELVEYVKFHFAEEEKLMEEMNYPEIEEHRELHEKLTRHVVAILLRLKNEQEFSIYELLSFLKDWWNEHIGEEDKKIGQCLSIRALKSSK